MLPFIFFNLLLTTETELGTEDTRLGERWQRRQQRVTTTRFTSLVIGLIMCEPSQGSKEYSITENRKSVRISLTKFCSHHYVLFQHRKFKFLSWRPFCLWLLLCFFRRINQSDRSLFSHFFTFFYSLILVFLQLLKLKY